MRNWKLEHVYDEMTAICRVVAKLLAWGGKKYWFIALIQFYKIPVRDLRSWKKNNALNRAERKKVIKMMDIIH